LLTALLGALALAPLYWAAVPERWRRETLTALSLLGLALYRPELALFAVAFTSLLWLAVRLVAALGRRSGAIALWGSIAALVALFVWNKQGGSGAGALPSQGGLALVGTSYIVLKAAALLADVRRGTLDVPRPGELLAWLAFLPTYPSGPIERFDHFRPQRGAWDRARALRGLERILFGLVKALVFAHQLGLWAAPILSDPAAHAPLARVLALYAFMLQFYFDFAGYSDIAIGLAAVYGMEIQENFDRPLLQRNLAQLWRRWHMTLTNWLRAYLFVPVSHGLLRRSDAGARWPLVLAQGVTMGVCGLWHGLGWNFLTWGLLQALGLVWVGIVARDLGRALPAGVVGFWRRSPFARVVATALTVSYFAATAIFLRMDAASAARYLLGALGG
jgi:alginate O-acetyltransferase complex protein AlgI